MNAMIIAKKIGHTLWVSILLHLLLITGFSVVLVLQPPKEEDKPALDIPSYVYNDPLTPMTPKSQSKPNSAQKPEAPQKQALPLKTVSPSTKSDFANLKKWRQAIRATSNSIARNTEEVHLIGE